MNAEGTTSALLLQYETTVVHGRRQKSFSENLNNPAGGMVAGSKPEVRQDVLERLEPGVIVQGSCLGDIRDQLGIAPEDVSSTQFSKAVRSLHYNHGVITYGRTWTDDPNAQSKGYYISLRQPLNG